MYNNLTGRMLTERPAGSGALRTASLAGQRNEMSNMRYSFSRWLWLGLVGCLGALLIAGNSSEAASRRRIRSTVTKTRTKSRTAVRRLPRIAAPTMDGEDRTVRLRLVVAAGNGARVTLDVDQGVGRLMNHSEKMLENDIYLTAGKTYTFTYHYEDYDSDSPYYAARTWLERDGNFLFDFAHARRKPGGKMAVYKRSIYIS
jgi:hypothetical protein